MYCTPGRIADSSSLKTESYKYLTVTSLEDVTKNVQYLNINKAKPLNCIENKSRRRKKIPTSQNRPSCPIKEEDLYEVTKC